MLAYGPTEAVLKVFETINTHLLTNTALLNTDGIFRISSAGRKHSDLMTSIINNETINWKNFTAYDCANALKYTLMHHELLPAGDERVADFVVKLKNPALDSGLALEELIASLTQNDEERNIAKTLNVAMDISRRTATQAAHNQMIPSNLAVVFGPGIANVLSLDADVGDDVMANMLFPASFLNPAITDLIEMGLPDVVKEIAGIRRNTLENAANAYTGASQMLKIAGKHMAEIFVDLGNANKLLTKYEEILNKSGLPKPAKKDIKTQIAALKGKIENLGRTFQTWKKESQKHLNFVAKFDNYSSGLRESCDRLDVLLADISPTPSDEELSDDEKIEAPKKDKKQPPKVPPLRMSALGQGSGSGSGSGTPDDVPPSPKTPKRSR